VATPVYTFRSMTADDLRMLKHWLTEAHVRQWWGDPVEQFGLVSGDLDEPAMDQYIVYLEGSPLAYIQSGLLSAWDYGLGEHPALTRCIDQFIGEPQMIGRGHGSAFVRQFVDKQLHKGIPRIVTDPDPTNTRAVRSYEKAGFSRKHIVETPDGPALLMVRDP
jgi:aminoglycoside 6'-N-acetyltransferase